jgi:hypothetical protein
MRFGKSDTTKILGECSTFLCNRNRENPRVPVIFERCLNMLVLYVAALRCVRDLDADRGGWCGRHVSPSPIYMRSFIKGCPLTIRG